MSAATAGQLLHLFADPIHARCIDRVGGTELSRPLQLLGALIDRDDVRADLRRKLHRVDAHTAATEDHNGVSRTHLRAILHRVEGRRQGIGDDRSLLQHDRLWKVQNVLCRHRDELRVRAVEVIAQHRHVRADVLAPHATELALAAGQNRRDQNTLTLANVDHVGTGLLDDPRRFVTEHERRFLERRDAVLDVMEVGVAGSTRGDPDEHIAWPDLGDRDVVDLEPDFRSMKNRSLHRSILPASASGFARMPAHEPVMRVPIAAAVSQGMRRSPRGRLQYS